jgi:hypothetical protein
MHTLLAYWRSLLGSQLPPTSEEYEEARQRELARFNFRLTSITGRTFHTPEDSKLLEGDSEDRRRGNGRSVKLSQVEFCALNRQR